MIQVEALLRERYKGVDKRLGKYPAPARRPTETAVVIQLQPKPLWSVSDLSFDHHVRVWKWHLASKVTDRFESYIRNRCLELRVDYDVIVRKTLSREHTAFRQIIWYELRVKFGLSYPHIARMMGARDHTTIMAGVKRVERLYESGEPETIPAVKRLMDDRDLNNRVQRAFRRKRTFTDLESMFSVPAPAISIVSKLEHWPMESRINSGLRCNMAALRRDFLSGAQIKWICQKHGMSETTFRKIRREYGWVRE